MAQLISEAALQSARCDGAEILAVVKLKAAPCDTAKAVRLFQHRVAYRREVAGRGIDDLQHLGGRGLLLQGLARLDDQPCILHRDDRLRREILQQRDLLAGEWANFLAKNDDRTEKNIVFAQSYEQTASDASNIAAFACRRIGAVNIGFVNIGDMNNVLTAD